MNGTPLSTIIHAVHSTIGAIGITSNAFLTLLILTKTPRYFLTYSFILFNCALSDLIEVVADTMAMQRFVFAFPMQIFISYGPCGIVSPWFCFLNTCIIVQGVVQSTMLLAVSFWYRRVVLIAQAPSIKRLAIIIACTYAANIAVMFSFLSTSADENILRTQFLMIHPEENVTGLVFAGQANALAIPALIALSYYCTAPLLGYIVIFVMRRKAVECLKLRSRDMSQRTQQTHGSLITALTFHAFSPIFTAFGVFTALPQLFGIVQKNIFAEIFMISSISFPPLINPFLTMAFVAPYRRFIIQIFRPKSPTSKLSTASSPGTISAGQ